MIVIESENVNANMRGMWIGIEMGIRTRGNGMVIAIENGKGIGIAISGIIMG